LLFFNIKLAILEILAALALRESVWGS